MRWLLWVGVLALASLAHAQEAQPNPFQTREMPVTSFDGLEVAGPFKVFVLAGQEPGKVSLVGPPALLNDTLATVSGKKLTIRFRDGANWSWNPGSGVNVVVTAPSLTSARVQGAAQVEIDGPKGDTFSAATDGAGSIALHQLNARRVLFATGGSGSITAEGIADEGTYAVGGSGSIDAKRLRVQTARIALGGAGSIYADVSRTATISAGGSGLVDVVGGASCIKSGANPQHIECR